MFSSLPSAGKIYVSSAKTRHKNISSARRKRKKSEARNNFEQSTDDTLISLAAETESHFNSQDDVSTLTNDGKDRKVKFKGSDILNIKHDKADSNSHKSKQKEYEASSDYDPYGIADQGVPATNNYVEIAIGSDESEEDIDSYLSCAKDSEKTEEIGGITSDITSLEDRNQEHVFHSNECDSDEDLELSANKFVSMKSSRSCSLNSASSLSRFAIQNDENSLELRTQSDSQSLLFNDIPPDKQLDKKIAIEGSDSLNDSLPDVIENCLVQEDRNDIGKCSTEECLDSSKAAIDENIYPESFDPQNILNQNMVPDNKLVKTEKTNDGESKSDVNSLDKHDSVKNDYTDDGLSSQDNSEQNSCTESVLGDSKHFLTDNLSQADLFKVQSKENVSNKVTDSSVIVGSNVKTINSKSVQKLIQYSPNIKRSSSLPSDLLALNCERCEESVGSNVTLSSDKATITNDLIITKKLDDKEEEKKEICKSESTSVASSADLPLINKLPILTTMKARMRNYVFGCKGTKGALLGSEELSRFFPQSRVTIFVGTWNMNGYDAPGNIDDFLLPLAVDSIPDIYAIGVQESMQSKSEWELLLQTTLGPSHVLFTSSSLGVLHLAIFLRRDLIWFCSEPEDCSVATRVGSMVKTKGAVAVCFMLFGSSFLFVNSHLTAHEQNLVDRISDYKKICAGLNLPRLIPLKTGQYTQDVTSKFDNVFWCGDLNFRITWERPAVIHFVKENIQSDCKSGNLLMDHDQLQKAIKDGVAFHGFKEGIINFNPSFKFDVGTNTFDSVKQRVPSYTDRILYRSKDSASIQCLHYNCASELVTSDHKPVFAIFSVSLKPGRDNVPLAAGIFKRDVYLEALKRRANFLEVNNNQKQSAICNVM